MLLFIQENIRNPYLDPIFKAITHMGDGGIIWIVLTLIMLCFKKTRYAGICSGIALLGVFFFNNQLLKKLFNRTRPYETINDLICIVSPAVDASFPSGHTCTGFAFVAATYGLVQKKYSYFLLLLASLIAFSRLYVGIHYPTDVLGGVVVGILIGLLAKQITKRKKKGPG